MLSSFGHLCHGDGGDGGCGGVGVGSAAAAPLSNKAHGSVINMSRAQHEPEQHRAPGSVGKTHTYCWSNCNTGARPLVMVREGTRRHHHSNLSSSPTHTHDAIYTHTHAAPEGDRIIIVVPKML